MDRTARGGVEYIGEVEATEDADDDPATRAVSKAASLGQHASRAVQNRQVRPLCMQGIDRATLHGIEYEEQ